MYCCASSRMRTVHGNVPSRSSQSQRLLRDSKEIGRCDIRVALRELLSYSLARFDLARGELRVARQDTACDVAADVQVVEFGFPHSPGLGDFVLHGLQMAVFL